ncbi:MAG: hypothetical protein ACRCYY_19880 [Trueperaceae bacterium]
MAEQIIWISLPDSENRAWHSLDYRDSKIVYFNGLILLCHEVIKDSDTDTLASSLKAIERGDRVKVYSNHETPIELLVETVQKVLVSSQLLMRGVGLDKRRGVSRVVLYG